MAFTGLLGSSDSRLGNIVLGSSGAAAPDFDPHVTHTLALSQTAQASITYNRAVTDTLTLTQLARYFTPLVPLVGYSGGQTRYVLVRDLTIDQDLYELNPDTLFDYPASITKLMTSLLIWEYKNTVLDTDFVTITTPDLTDPSGFAFSTGGFANGDVISWRGLLTSIHVASASDACQAAARIIGHEIYVAAGNTGNDGNQRFIDTMNARAITLGLTNTYFFDSWGASRSGSTTRNQTTARDNAKLAAATIGSISTLATMSGLATTTWPVTGPGARTLTWTADDRLVNGPSLSQAGIKDANIVGGKPGEWITNGDHYSVSNIWTAPSGNKIVITTLNAQSWLELTFDQYAIIFAILKDWPYLEVTPTTGDANFTNVKLLVGADGSIVDESSVHRTLTSTSVTIGSPIIAGSTGSAVFNANSDGITAADAADLEIGAGDGTIELWFATATIPASEVLFFAKLNSSSGAKEYAVNYYPPTRTFSLFVSGDGVNWQNISAFSLSAEQEATFFNGATRHIAFVKSGSNCTLYLNGERSTATITTVGTVADTGELLSIGYPSASLTPIAAYDDYRFSKGLARYTAEKVTLAARKFPRISSGDLSVGQTLVMSQVAHPSMTYNLSVSHTLTLTQGAFKVSDATADSVLTLTQTVTVKKVRYVYASNTLTLSQDLSREMTYNRTVNQGMALAHAATRTMSFYRAVSQPLVLTQTDSQTNSKLASNTLVLSQSATYTYSHGARNALELTQLVERSITKLESLHDFLGLFHTVTTIGTYNKAVSQALVLTQSATVTNTKSVKQTLNLTDLAEAVLAKPAFSTLLLFDNASVTKTSNLAADNLLILNQQVTVRRSIAVFASNALGLSQFVRGTKVLHASASNTLNLTQELVQQRYARTLSQTLTLTQTTTVRKIVNVSVTQSLTLTATVGLSKTIVRHVTDTLVFQNSFQKYIGIANQPYVSIPVVQGVLIKKKCIFIMEAPGLSIVLPCPEFNDGEAATGKLTVKRAMDGTRRIYRRDSPTSKLKYDFVMDRKKAIELRAFIMSQNSNLLKITNHKGEIWYVLLTNSPFTFTEAAFWDSSWGNKSTITLELEGTRVN